MAKGKDDQRRSIMNKNKDKVNNRRKSVRKNTQATLPKEHCNEMSLSYLFAHGLGNAGSLCSIQFTEFPSDMFKKQNLNYVLSECSTCTGNCS